MCETSPLSNTKHVLEQPKKRQAPRDKIPAEPSGPEPDDPEAAYGQSSF